MAGNSRFLKTLKRAGWRTRLNKINEIINGYNPLLALNIQTVTPPGKLEVIYSKHNVVLVLINYQPQIDDLDARVTALEAIAADHEARITALEP